MITLFHPFYNQHEMVAQHKNMWSQHPKNVLKYAFIDDGSKECIPLKMLNAGTKVYRIIQDIPWNVAGARNLGFTTADTEWVMCFDIDYIVTPAAVRKIAELDLSDPNTIYCFRKDNVQDGYALNILMNRKRYLETGYDEDFSGNYGREDNFFTDCVRHYKFNRVNVRVPLVHVAEGATPNMTRDTTINSVKHKQKLAELQAGTYKNGPMLRFDWVDQSNRTQVHWL